MEISFTAVLHSKKTDAPREIGISEKYKEYAGTYEVREISAKEGIEAVNVLIAKHKDFQEDPDQIKVEELRKVHIEKATTLNGKPLLIGDLAKFPNKLWLLLISANEVLNGVSNDEARFLLSPYGKSEQPSIQP